MPTGTEVVLSQDAYTLTIDNAGTASGAHRTSGLGRGSFQLPDAFTGTEVTVQVSNDDQAPSNWSSVPVEGNEANPITVSADGAYALPMKTGFFKWFRLLSGSSEGAERTIRIFVAT